MGGWCVHGGSQGERAALCLQMRPEVDTTVHMVQGVGTAFFQQLSPEATLRVFLSETQDATCWETSKVCFSPPYSSPQTPKPAPICLTQSS